MIVDMSRPVFRYMSQKQFQKAPLSQLMERITQMRVVPDLLPLDVAPTVQVNIKLDNDTIVEPGVFIKPEQVRKQGGWLSWILILVSSELAFARD